jgi:hypothetical protein
MSDLSKLAEPVVTNLLQSDVDQLYEQLGMRAKTMAADLSAAGQLDPTVRHDERTMGALDSVKRFGQRIFRRWNREAYELMCGKSADDAQDRERLVKATGIGDVAVASVLTGLLVSSFGLAPAIAAVLAALVVKRFFRPAHEEFCEVWKESLEE